MNFSDDEILEIVEEVTSTVGQILLRHRELTEGLLDLGQTERSQQKIDDLKNRLDLEKGRLTKIRHSQQRKRELERIRKSHDKETQTEGDSKKFFPIQDQRGRTVGWVKTVTKSRVDVLDQRGRVVGRFINGQTYDQHGRTVGRGNQGLRVLGQELKKVT